MLNPASAAMNMLMTMAAPMMPPIRHSSNHQKVNIETTIAQPTPFSRPTISSLRIMPIALALLICPRAMARVMIVRDWVPATPPMLGTTGMSTASSTILSIVV